MFTSFGKNQINESKKFFQQEQKKAKKFFTKNEVSRITRDLEKKVDK